MTRKLNTWKEIAQYLGKGVRTVQRYEKGFGLPVRRLKENGTGSVVAIAGELDFWLETHTTQGRPAFALESEIEMLQKQLAFMKAENERLQDELRAIRTARPAMSLSGFVTAGDNGLPTHWDRVLSSSAAIRQKTAEVLDRARDLQFMCRHKEGSPRWGAHITRETMS